MRVRSLCSQCRHSKTTSAAHGRVMSHDWICAYVGQCGQQALEFLKLVEQGVGIVQLGQHKYRQEFLGGRNC